MGKTIEEIINMWSEQLERNADTFTTEAVKGTLTLLMLWSMPGLGYYLSNDSLLHGFRSEPMGR
jgi:hypothetical protein